MGFWQSEEQAAQERLCNAVIRAASEVRRELGGRFSAEVYRAALRCELEHRALPVAEQPSLCVKYHGRVVGEFCPDLLVGEQLLVDLASAPYLPHQKLQDTQRALRATRVPRGLVLNFGAAKLEFRRLTRAA